MYKFTNLSFLLLHKNGSVAVARLDIEQVQCCESNQQNIKFCVYKAQLQKLGFLSSKINNLEKI